MMGKSLIFYHSIFRRPAQDAPAGSGEGKENAALPEKNGQSGKMRREHIKIDKMGGTWYIRLAGKNGKVSHFPAKEVRDVVTYGDILHTRWSSSVLRL